MTREEFCKKCVDTAFEQYPKLRRDDSWVAMMNRFHITDESAYDLYVEVTGNAVNDALRNKDTWREKTYQGSAIKDVRDGWFSVEVREWRNKVGILVDWNTDRIGATCFKIL